MNHVERTVYANATLSHNYMMYIDHNEINQGNKSRFINDYRYTAPC